MSEEKFDVIVIGGGPGGYVTAIRAAQLGLKTSCVDERKHLGGTCLNVGCIPSKALLQSSERYDEVCNRLSAHGISPRGVDLDLAKMMKRKDDVVAGLTDGVAELFRKNGVAWICGRGRLSGDRRVVVSSSQDEKTLSADAIVIATGSDTVPLPGVDVDEQMIVSSTGALSLDAVPEHLVVIGGGYIGLEMGCVWRRLGAQVTCIEALGRVLPGMDDEIGRAAEKALAAQGIEFRLGLKVAKAERSDRGVRLSTEAEDGEEGETLECDIVLVAVGRGPKTEGLGLEEAGIAVDDRGFVKVDRQFRTSAKGIFAIGDVVGEPMLAHKAQDEGIACAEIIAGRNGHVNYEAIPAIIYTRPAIASIGRTEEQLKEAGTDYNVGRFPFKANGRARCNADEEGFVKILADDSSDLFLGAHILGAEADTLIHEIVAALEFGASTEELGRMCHGHPTLNESVREAALAVADRGIHL